METDSRTKWAIYNNPLPLLEIKNKKIISAIDSYLPWDTGIEIECIRPPFYKHEDFTSIPDIKAVDGWDSEQRFRIPSGLKGMVCLWNILEACKVNLELNDLSGHHYHIDWTELYSGIDRLSSLLNDNREWIVKELDSWGYKGTYNSRDGSWIRWNSIGTLEFRIGNPTYDYNTIITRILHAQDISRRLKLIALNGYLKTTPEERELHRLQQELKEKNNLLNAPKSMDSILEFREIKNRVNRI